MNRLLVAITLIAALALLPLGCASETPDAEPGSDGLHSIVPDVVGLTEDEATIALDDAGYQVGEVTFEAIEDAAAGTVARQEPIPSTSAPRDSTVDLVIAE